ncbi:MAG: hypothetical protein ACPGPE_00510 [Planctomycetota bacterium]
MNAIEKLLETTLELATVSLSQALQDWNVQVGFMAKLGEGVALIARTNDAVDARIRDDTHVHVATRVEHAARGEFELLFPMAGARQLLCAALCLPGDEDGDLTQGMDEMEIDALHEMMNLLCGSVNSVYGDYDLRLSQNVEDLQVKQREGGPDVDLRGVVVVFPLELEGAGSHQLVQVLPLPTALAMARAIETRQAA